MRKSRILAAAMLLMLAGCMNNLGPMEPDELAGIPLTVRATVGDSGTKTVLQSDGVYWLSGDAINMFYGSKFDGRFVTELAEPSKVAEFRGELTVVTGTSNPGGESQNYWGVYPYDAGNTCDGSGVMLTIPSAQPGAAGTFAPNLNPTVATGPGLDLAFYNVGSWLMFSVAQEGITSATLKGNGNEDLAGQIYVTMDGSGHPVSTMVSGTKNITITPAEGSFAPGEFYYIVLFPQTLSQGFTLTLNKGALSAEKVISSQLTFPRNTPLQLSTADKNLEFSSAVPVPEMVDLGLSVKWASFNLGASVPEECGDYYAWGETEPKEDFSWGTYLWSNGSKDKLTKYCPFDEPEFWAGVGLPDGKLVLDPEDDAARVNLGDKWRIPTEEELEELRTQCYWTRVTQNGVTGYLAESKRNGNSIFFPRTGIRVGTGFDENYKYVGMYRHYYLGVRENTAGPSSTPALVLMGEDEHNIGGLARWMGLPIRPVYGDPISVEDISIYAVINSYNNCMNDAAVSILINETVSMTASVTPTNATYRNVTWSSSNTSVATVQNDGTVMGVAAGFATISAYADGKSASCTVIVTAAEGPEAVDLGLSVKWASVELDASRPGEFGKTYAWGDCEEYTSGWYKWFYFYEDWSDPLGMRLVKYIKKYCPTDRPELWAGVSRGSWNNSDLPDGLTVITLEDDAAHVQLGGTWRIPTKDEIDELVSGCTWTKTTIIRGASYQNRQGYIAISKSNGNCIFFLDFSGNSALGIWSSSLNPDNPFGAYYLKFAYESLPLLTWTNRTINNEYRPNVLCIRPVKD